MSEAGPLGEKNENRSEQNPAENHANMETLPPTGSDAANRPPPSSPDGDTPPQKVGRYDIVELLGHGAMGTVYLGHDTELDRKVALKIPKQHVDDPELKERFLREARAAATLHHRNICPVYDIGESDGVNFITMAFVEGDPLSESISSDGAWSAGDAVAVVRKLADALRKAHDQGIIHRDLKPSNIMIDREREPVIMDFGLARQIDQSEDERLTQSGSILGSPAYMSPEQVECDAERIGPASDVYSLGVILYELLTGTIPFRGSIASVIGQVVTCEPTKPTQINPKIDARLESICLKMMSKRIEDRISSMQDVVDVLDEYLRDPMPASVPKTSRGPAAETVEATATLGNEAQGAEAQPTAVALHIPKWAIWLAIGFVAIGFGITWKLMTLMLATNTNDKNFSVSEDFRNQIQESGHVLFLDDKEFSVDQLGALLNLEPGTHFFKVMHGSKTVDNDPIVVDEENPMDYTINYDEEKGYHVVAKPRAPADDGTGTDDGDPVDETSNEP